MLAESSSVCPDLRTAFSCRTRHRSGPPGVVGTDRISPVHRHFIPPTACCLVLTRGGVGMTKFPGTLARSAAARAVVALPTPGSPIRDASGVDPVPAPWSGPWYGSGQHRNRLRDAARRPAHGAGSDPYGGGPVGDDPVLRRPVIRRSATIWALRAPCCTLLARCCRWRHRWAYSSVGQSASLIRTRSLVQVQLGPPDRPPLVGELLVIRTRPVPGAARRGLWEPRRPEEPRNAPSHGSRCAGCPPRRAASSAPRAGNARRRGRVGSRALSPRRG